VGEVKEEHAVYDAREVLDKVSERIKVKSRTHLAKEIGVAQSTLHYNEAQNELPWRSLINYAAAKGWSIDELLGLKSGSSELSNTQADVRAIGNSQNLSEERLNTDFALKCCKLVVQTIERYLAHPDVQQRRLGEKRLSELRVDLVEILMRIALETQCNQVLIDSTCRSILTIKQAY
jgi:hypothetical protein